MRNAACFLLFVFLCVFIALFTSVFPNHKRNCELYEKGSVLRHEKDLIAKRNDYLRAEIIALQTDPFFIEAVARKKYNLIKNGELIIEEADKTDSRENSGDSGSF